jgi:hypothetical protein
MLGAIELKELVDPSLPKRAIDWKAKPHQRLNNVKTSINKLVPKILPH